MGGSSVTGGPPWRSRVPYRRADNLASLLAYTVYLLSRRGGIAPNNLSARTLQAGGRDAGVLVAPTHLNLEARSGHPRAPPAECCSTHVPPN